MIHTLKSLHIAGGGLAGLALGLLLRRHEVPVTISEALHYPRHRVCGEFLSGRGQQILTDLGVLQSLSEDEVAEARSMAFFRGTRGGKIARLPRAAMCVSRYVLDAALARMFEASGGELRVGERLPLDAREGLVRAAGRRQAEHQRTGQWIGLKTHVRNVELAADLEMHMVPDGYAGLCRLRKGEVNVCGLFRWDPARGKLTNPSAVLRGPVGSQLHQRLLHAKFIDKSFCSVAALDPWPRFENNDGQFCVGDALTMIPPITGNGMSLALESATLAAAPLIEYSAGRLTWMQSIATARTAFRTGFNTRLRWAAMLQRAVLASPLRPLVPFLTASPILTRALFARTRDFGSLSNH